MKEITLTLAEANVLHDIIAPSRGVQVGGGVHVEIPDDWEARVRAGERVPGCTYYAPGSVDLADAEQAIIAASTDPRLDDIKAAVLAAPEIDTP